MRKASWGVIAAAMLLSAAVFVPSWGAEPADKGFSAFTQPSKKRMLSFVRPAQIVERPVKKGDVVKKGDLIARQDDSEEQQVLRAAEKDANDDTEINAEKTVREADQVDLDKKSKNNSATATEIAEAAVKVKVDDARILLAKAKKEKAAIEVERNKAIIEKLKLTSPIDGIISEVFTDVGEATDGQNMKVAEVVQIDPLWVETPVPILQARKLKDGDEASVLFSDGKVRKGTVKQESTVADPASGTLKVKVVIPNPEKLWAGEQVRVTFPGAAVASGSAVSR